MEQQTGHSVQAQGMYKQSCLEVIAQASVMHGSDSNTYWLAKMCKEGSVRRGDDSMQSKSKCQ